MEIQEPLEYNALQGRRWVLLAEYFAEDALPGV